MRKMFMLFSSAITAHEKFQDNKGKKVPNLRKTYNTTSRRQRTNTPNNNLHNPTQKTTYSATRNIFKTAVEDIVKRFPLHWWYPSSLFIGSKTSTFSVSSVCDEKYINATL